nr:unnamed protein product [Callosobruchus analis]
MAQAWQPNEEYLSSLVSMGISQEIATQALFCTGNRSIDEAVNFVFNNEEDEISTETVDMHINNLVLNETGDDGEYEDYCKMTFVVNSSLKMGVGKIAAQVGHACLGLYRNMLPQYKELLSKWEYTGEKKIVLKGDDENHLQQLHQMAKEHNVPSYLVHDAGHTQVAPNSVTVLSLFGLEEDINKITGKLSLL